MIKGQYLQLGFLSILFAMNSAMGSPPPVISLEKILSYAESNSEFISVDTYKELAAHQAIEIAKAGYYPTLSFEAIDTKGFPGSSNLSGMRGLMNSPFRKGASAGLKVEQTIWDFGRTSSAVKSAKFKTDYAKENTRVTAYQVQTLAMQSFYNCAFYKSQASLWGSLSSESEMITKEALRFVNTGQRSVVDKYISQAQTQDAQTTQAYFAELEKGSLRELEVITGLSENSFSCPSLESVTQSPYSKQVNLYNSPYILRAKIGVDVAKAELDREKANFMPEIFAIASAGAMESTNISTIQKEPYAVGIAVSLPLYNKAFSGKIKEAEAEFSAQQQEVEAQKQYLEEMNAKFDEAINASHTRLQHLITELNNAEEGYKVAKQRYFSMETDLYDLRIMYEILARIQNDIGSTQTVLLQSMGEKALLNGSLAMGSTRRY